MTLFWLTIAAAAPLTLTNLDDGSVMGEVVLNVPQHVVLEELSDFRSAVMMVPSIHEAKVVPSTDCDTLDVAAGTIAGTVRYRSKRCRTGKGWSERLVSSEDFKDYGTDWVIEEENGHTSVKLRVFTQPRMFAPLFVRQAFMRHSVRQVLDTLTDRVAPNPS